MQATISADIVASTTFSVEDTVFLKSQMHSFFQQLEVSYPGCWGRLIKGDYIECYVPDASDAFRIALMLKTFIKSIGIKSEDKAFITYGVRIAIGIGTMRLVDRGQDLMDGEAIYRSGRALAGMKNLLKGSLYVETGEASYQLAIQTVGMLTDALLNQMTSRQSQVVFYKLQSKNEEDIAALLGITQAGVNQHSSLAKWYSIEQALIYYEQVNFDRYE
ncbi:RNA polymerase subunit sigma-70 [uncultured Bacteroides sp.]|uniref:helix-turn-helix transcriptional regulator n=1 Tax=uncultured Bacteroides sp. TaxID=162156 RepID=UPI002613D77F|nr:RNA polymerase subunit sigma-70 [uncultured Bacteroides sp.]